ncbi:MAG TPA: hypothetical protein VH349_18200 [Ktedonobacterales bacterium]|jgi:hypothetical protein
MANGECVACHAQATGEPVSLRATPASYAVEMSQARGWAASAQNRSVFSRDGRAYRRLVKKAWRGGREYGGHSTDGIGGDALDDDLRIAESAVNKIDVIGWTLM